MATVFSSAKDEALRCAEKGLPEEPEQLRRLDRRARLIIALFHRQDSIVTADVAKTLGVAERTARDLMKEWVTDGWLQIADPSKKARRYILTAEYRQFIGRMSAE
jgi:transposase